MNRMYGMDTGWKFRIDRGEDGTAGDHRSVYLGVKAGGVKGPASKSYDDSGWEEIDLPHDYVVGLPIREEYGYGDCHEKPDAWYRKCFSLDESFRDRQIGICFEGIAMQAEIYLNGSLVRRSFSAYTEQYIDVTDRIYAGGRVNVLAVHTHASGELAECWSYEGGGIYRHVRLYSKPAECHIAHNGAFVSSEPVGTEDGVWRVRYRVGLENSSYEDSTCQVMTELSRNGKVILSRISAPVSVGALSSVTTELTDRIADPVLWDTDHPELYGFRVCVIRNGEITDEETGETGFRYFRFDSRKGFFLNGRSLKLKGVSCHQDHAGVGIAVPDALQYERLRKLKEMGVNLYRSGHNNPAREVLTFCDRLGILVMDENRHFEVSEENLRHLAIVTERDRNHPSVILYCLMNEEPLQNTEEGRRIYRRMKAHIRRYDDTRLFTGAMHGNTEGAGREMDVCGINYAYGYLDALHKNAPDVCLLGSENNSQISTRGCTVTDTAGAHCISELDDAFVPWGNSVRGNFAFAREREYLAGTTIWTGFDYHGETIMSWPTVLSQYGLMDLCGFPKGVSYFCRATYSEEPMMKILPHWNFREGETARIVTVSNCGEVELFVNGSSLGRRDNDCCKQNAWQIPFVPGSLRAVGYRDGKPAAEDTVYTYGKAERLVLETNGDTFDDSGSDTVILNCHAVDGEGHFCGDASHLLTFGTEGGIRLIGVGNGDQNCHDGECCGTRRLFYGRAQAIFRVCRGAESGKITVSAEGLAGAVFLPTIRHSDALPVIGSTVSHSVTSLEATPASETRIDPHMAVKADDMNTFLPVELEDTRFQEDYHAGWKLYRALVKLPASLGDSTVERDFSLCLDDVKVNRMYVYADGREIYRTEITHRYVTGSVTCGFRGYEGRTAELRILVHINMESPEGAGFRRSFRIT